MLYHAKIRIDYATNKAFYKFYCLIIENLEKYLYKNNLNINL
nr:MAG TPA: hypothetical protein [Siphoviridae sp. ctUxW2]